MNGSGIALLVIGLGAVASGIWWFNNFDVQTYVCPQDVPIKCAPGPRVSSNPVGLWTAMAGAALVTLAARRLTLRERYG